MEAADQETREFNWFPNAKAVASPAVVEGIRKQVDPDFIKTFWETRFPGLIPKELVVSGY